MTNKLKTVQVELTVEAANYLAWFAEHEMYSDDISSIVMDHMQEWASREYVLKIGYMRRDGMEVPENLEELMKVLDTEYEEFRKKGGLDCPND